MSGEWSNQQYCWDRPEYIEDSRRLEETCCYSDFSRKPSANAGVKNFQMNKLIMIIIFCKHL